MPRLNDLTGKTFGLLQVVKRTGTHPGTHKPMWLCQCACGTQRYVVGTALASGHTQSCGCSRTRPRVHGKRYSRAYNTWSNMHQRCRNPRHPRYGDWGGRGIVICERWYSFENFYADMGDPLPGMTLDRQNNDGPYAPHNCRWATLAEQNQNKRRLTAV